MIDLGLPALALAGAAVMTWIIKGYTRRSNILDVPGARSAHTSPMPVGGGVAIVLAFMLPALVYTVEGVVPGRVMISLLGALAIAGLGLWDDIRPLNLRVRLLVQCLAVVWVLAWLGYFPVIRVLGRIIEIPGLVHGLSLLSLIWLVNLYNFMDGIDGLAAGESVFITVMVCQFAIVGENHQLAILSALLCAASIGFLIWNWPPAKIFMGDAGSGFLGIALGVLALLSMQQGSLSIWTWLLLLGVFVVDATYTLICRIIAGKKWYEGHSTHGYQHAARQFGSHGRVTAGVGVINLFWLAPLAWVTVNYPQFGMVVAIIGLLPLVWLAYHLGAGHSQQADLVTVQK